jgi:hypothetical protein
MTCFNIRYTFTIYIITVRQQSIRLCMKCHEVTRHEFMAKVSHVKLLLFHVDNYEQFCAKCDHVRYVKGR